MHTRPASPLPRGRGMRRPGEPGGGGGKERPFAHIEWVSVVFVPDEAGAPTVKRGKLEFKQVIKCPLMSMNVHAGARDRAGHEIRVGIGFQVP